MINILDKHFMDRCSEKTLQSNEKGFFMSFVRHVQETAGEKWIKTTFGKIKSDGDKIRAIFTEKKIKTAVCDVLSNVQELYREKDNKIAERAYFEAQKEFRANLPKSMALFSQCILRIDPKTSEAKTKQYLSLALLGRAKALILKQEYEAALVDLQQALKENLPQARKYDVLCKMAICHKILGSFEKAKVAFNLCEKLLGDDKQRIEELKNEMEKDYRAKNETNRKVLSTINNKSNILPNATEKLAVKHTEDLGKHVVAKENILTGETLVVEPPYAACLLPEYFGTHCHHCFERLLAPYGCPLCSNVAFCKPECQSAALSTYHRHECKFINLLIGSGMSILSHTALRMITQSDLPKMLEIYGNREKESAYNLCTNAVKRSAEDFLQRTLMAVFLLRCLQKSGYFSNRTRDEIPTEDEYKIGELLLYNLQMLQFNAHEIYETGHTQNHRFRESKAFYIAVGVYPTVALFNHDCYPAVTRHFVGKTIVIHSARPLVTGELVAENYGPIFTRKSLIERQKSLAARYWFKCKCLCCTENWPCVNNGLEGVSKRLRCPSVGCRYIFTVTKAKEGGKCPNCKQEINLKKILEEVVKCEENYRKGFEYMEKEKPGEAIRLICPAIDTFHRIAMPPHRETHIAQEILRACLADFGNVCECLQKLNK